MTNLPPPAAPTPANSVFSNRPLYVTVHAVQILRLSIWKFATVGDSRYFKIEAHHCSLVSVVQFSKHC